MQTKRFDLNLPHTDSYLEAILLFLLLYYIMQHYSKFTFND